MITVTINIKEDTDLNYVDTLVAGLNTYLDEELPKRLLTVGESIASEARANAPVKTGQLRASISAVVSGNSVEITCEVPYGKYQELGTRYIEGEHFLEDALDNNLEQIRTVIEETIQEYFKGVI